MTMNTGGVHAYGTFTADNKQFRITHPLDETKYLFHGCLEGPEGGVYYRGEGETVDGKAEVKLPDYFEALVLRDRRTVQLTAIVEDGKPSFAQLASSRVVKGRFTVYSSTPSQKFFWQVMAVRLEIEIERKKTDDEMEMDNPSHPKQETETA